MLYPMIFNPIFKERIWGGNLITKKIHTQYDIKADLIGESWDIVDREQDTSILKNGSLAGLSIRDIINKYGHELLGEKVDITKPFPLLVKILDAKEDLSLQVHPPKNKLSVLEGAESKTEFWYILERKKDAKIMLGLNNKIANVKEKFINSITKDDIKDFINIVDSKPNQLFYIPSGSIHAIGGGNLILEIQENSDTTYRISDWNRLDKNGKKREIHLKESIECLDDEAQKQSKIINVDVNNNNTILKTDLFNVSSYFIYGKKLINTTKDVFELISCTSGAINIIDSNNNLALQKGQTALLPAGYTGIIQSNTYSNYIITKIN